LTIVVDPIPRINLCCWIVGPESIEKVSFQFAQLLGWNDLARPFSLANPSAFPEMLVNRAVTDVEYASGFPDGAQMYVAPPGKLRNDQVTVRLFDGR
jgi:hypothetical protein